MSKFNERIKELRKNFGLTQKELGEKIGVTESHVRKWEISESFTSVPKLIRLSEIFDVSTDYLLGLTIDKKVPKQKELSDYSTDELMKELLRRWL